MNKVLIGHDEPVNLQAAKVFWKAPWWAKLTVEDKEVLTHTRLKLEDLVDVFSPPPVMPGGSHNQLFNWSGFKVKSQNGSIALVLGYAHYRHNGQRGRKIKQTLYWNGHGWMSESAKELRGRSARQNYWYAFFRGSVQVINIPGPKHWKMAGNYEPLTPPDEIDLQPEES